MVGSLVLDAMPTSWALGVSSNAKLWLACKLPSLAMICTCPSSTSIKPGAVITKRACPELVSIRTNWLSRCSFSREAPFIFKL